MKIIMLEENLFESFSKVFFGVGKPNELQPVW